MKVKELVRILKTLDQDKPIFMSSDSEGNSFSNPCEISKEIGFYVIWPDDSYIEPEELWNEN